VTRDVRISLLVTVAPAFLLVTFSYVFATDVEQVSVGVRDLDRTALSRGLVASLTSDGDFVIVAGFDQDSEVETLFARGIADLALVIPRGFSDLVSGGRSAEVLCIADGSDAIAASQAIGLLESRVNAFVARSARRHPGGGKGYVDVRARAWYNGALKALVSVVPGMVGIVLCIPSLALALSLTREKETGSFESLITTPVRGTEYLFGKLLAYQLCGMVGVILAWLVATLWFHVPFRGSFFVFLLLAADYLFASMGISTLVANFARNQQTAILLILLVFFVPSFFVTGLLVPVAEKPFAQSVAFVLPTTHFIAICRSVFLKGLRLASLWKPTLTLLAIGALSECVSLALFERRIS